MNNIALWQQDTENLLPATAQTPAEISRYAVQLSTKDKRQIIAAFDQKHFEMAISYLWDKTVTALKKELSAVGVSLLGEMLGRADVDEDDDVDDILTARDAVRLAEELGIVPSTAALRLRHTYELVTHFSQMGIDESDSEEIDESEAVASLKACIKGVLGRQKVEVARKFVDFREALERETLKEDDHHVETLKVSPYFFKKLTISVLMSAVKKSMGAHLEHALANINVLIPAIWPQLRDTEKWQIGHTYAEAFADGKTSAVRGLKSALLKVQGFDFVPENLRSETFIKAAESVLRAHDGMNNFHNELVPVNNLAKLGTIIPIPALPACTTALICVVLGNSYGVAWSTEPVASRILDGLSIERWGYYVNSVLPSDTRVLTKLYSDKPRANWINLSSRYNFGELQIKNKTVGLLIRASVEHKNDKVSKYAIRLLEEYYGPPNFLPGS